MKINNSGIQLLGGLLCVFGVSGVFLHISKDDGALAIAGAIVFASGTISKSLLK